MAVYDYFRRGFFPGRCRCYRCRRRIFLFLLMKKRNDYKMRLIDGGNIEQAESWLKKNPPLQGYNGGRYAWAYTEMIFLPRWFWRFFY